MTSADIRIDEATAPVRPILEIKDLAITFKTGSGEVKAVKNAHLSIMPGETVAIVGESGSGKSTTALAAIGLLPNNGRISAGQILLDGEDIAHASEKRMIELRGSHIGMVPQDPMSNLNPVWKIGYQVRETLKANGRPDGPEDVARVLAEAGLPDAARRAKQYPHEFSGGMRQRALIAIGLSCQPKLLIADEPTSALDVTVQRRILDHLDTMTTELGTSVLLITHDLGLAAERADKVIVMYQGNVVEAGPSLELLRNPQHPYTRRLVESAPSLASRRIQVAKEQGVEAEDLLAPVAAAKERVQDEVLQIKNLRKIYKLRQGLGKTSDFAAVDDVSFSVKRGTTTAIVGESGSGKSTVAKMVLQLEKPTEGQIVFDGVDTAGLKGKELFKFRRRVQPIFQDPYGSLDPMYNIFRTIEEPLRVHKIGNAASREKKVRELLDQVALPQSMMQRYPNELSGGQRQRIAIARALALDPEVIICDEAVSALDVLVQAQVLNLLADLQDNLGLTYLFITHDLAVVRQIADHVCVMEKGKLVETGSTDDVFDNPREAYTQALLDAIPGGSLLLPPAVA
ncbi:ABC transporter ATP-binding protein [Paenarthrobacter aurescens]|uniref:ABC transporter ATP-binding protein n=1 Tax=Paenarthrobacter aurescens TaxID=43663 RepID=A0A4Y3NNQ8_PAEAU|nr:ABC transporter ATP-binding protein [Paenarthrobacter aurescens]MDO6144220.1 ABC transporter ATP-binding protein [Paenarthrobacter aurescens]MDO6148067.1 ABC transporter ATP-binding protein [Paenarthrobacter aurescens]MDO6159311.1 ABC transporter ATP-binding protein [Paenarthrobacter aurescens]MDO6163294.1 ABC transporter ATP-binding protein [Paenarthrobacter aurescens]GEB20816.1 ABC transporter ATP-binding protein [Paenarthrobacter aurescens]